MPGVQQVINGLMTLQDKAFNPRKFPIKRVSFWEYQFKAEYNMTTVDLKNLEDNLWHSADVLRANTGLKSSEYSTPLLGLVFLKFADTKYKQFETAIMAEYAKLKGTRS